MRLICAALGVGTMLQAAVAHAIGLPVDLALVLLTDVSQTIDDGRFAIQKEGYRAAFRDPDVLAAILGGGIRRVAVAYAEFAGDSQARVVVGWTMIGIPDRPQPLPTRW